MWFTEVAAVENPGRDELDAFLRQTYQFLQFVVESPDFAFLWEYDESLRLLALEQLHTDVERGVGELRRAIPEIPEARLRQHGLLGRALRFKLRVMDAVGRQWDRVRGTVNVRDWFRKIIDAIDALLDSLIDAAGGAGGLIKEFKDALAALG